MAEENQVTSRKLAEENQVTTKNWKKVEVGRRLDEYNRRKREELKAKKSEVLTSSTHHGIGALLAVGRQVVLVIMFTKPRSMPS